MGRPVLFGGQALGQRVEFAHGRPHGLEDSHRGPADALQQRHIDLVPPALPARVLDQLESLPQNRAGQSDHRCSGGAGVTERCPQQLSRDVGQQRADPGVRCIGTPDGECPVITDRSGRRATPLIGPLS